MKKTSIIIMTLCLLGGCLGGYSPKSNFYRLVTAEDISAISDKNLSIGINEVSLPDYLEKRQIVFFDEGTHMGISESNRWGEDLSTMIQRSLTADISLYLPKSAVKSKTSLLEKFKYTVDVQIVRFDLIRGEKAVLEAWWYINSSGGNILISRKFVAEQKINDNFASFAQAQSNMIAEMSKEIAAAVIKL